MTDMVLTIGMRPEPEPKPEQEQCSLISLPWFKPEPCSLRCNFKDKARIWAEILDKKLTDRWAEAFADRCADRCAEAFDKKLDKKLNTKLAETLAETLLEELAETLLEESPKLKIKLYILLKYGLTSLLSSFQLIICRKKGRLKYGFQAAAMLALWLSHDVESNPGPRFTIRSCSEKLIRQLSEALRYHLPVEGSLWSESVAEAAYAAGYSTDCQWNNPSGNNKDKLTTLIERATELGRLLSEMDCLPTEFTQFVKNLDDYEIQKELVIHYKVEYFKTAADILLGVKSFREAHKQVVLERTIKLRSLISEGFQSPHSHLRNNQSCTSSDFETLTDTNSFCQNNNHQWEIQHVNSKSSPVSDIDNTIPSSQRAECRESNGCDTIQTTEVSAFPVPHSIMESRDVDKGIKSMQLTPAMSSCKEDGLQELDKTLPLDSNTTIGEVSDEDFGDILNWLHDDKQSQDVDLPDSTSYFLDMTQTQATGSPVTMGGNESQNQNCKVTPNHANLNAMHVLSTDTINPIIQMLSSDVSHFTEGSDQMCQDSQLNNYGQRETGRLVNERPLNHSYEIIDQLNLQFTQSSSHGNTIYSDRRIHESSLTEGSLVKTCNGGTSSGTMESDNLQTPELLIPSNPIPDRSQGTITPADLTHEDTDCRGAGPDTYLALENETGQQIADDSQFPSTEPDSEIPQQTTSLESFTHSNQDNRDHAKQRCREDAHFAQTNEAFGTHLPGTSTAGPDDQGITCEERNFDAVWKEISKLWSVVNESSRYSTQNRPAVQNRSEVNRHAADTPLLSHLEPTLPRLRSTKTPTRKRRLRSPDLVSKLRRQ